MSLRLALLLLVSVCAPAFAPEAVAQKPLAFDDHLTVKGEIPKIVCAIGDSFEPSNLDVLWRPASVVVLAEILSSETLLGTCPLLDDRRSVYVDPACRPNIYTWHRLHLVEVFKDQAGALADATEITIFELTHAGRSCGNSWNVLRPGLYVFFLDAFREGTFRLEDYLRIDGGRIRPKYGFMKTDDAEGFLAALRQMR